MALKKDIVDEKGVKTRYHAVKSFYVMDGKVIAQIKSWVNLETRDAEKLGESNNADARAYEAETDRMRAELDELSARLADGDETVRDQIVELTNTVNDRVADASRPVELPVVARNYGETKVVMDYFEPLTLSAIYERLTAEGGDFAGAEQV